MSESPTRIAVIGAGPSALSWLERLIASVDELHAADGLELWLIDPYAPGAGKIWRFDQSGLLRLNSLAADVTIFPDETVQCEGAVPGGPTLTDWLDAVRSGELRYEGAAAAVVAEQVADTTATSFPTRQLQHGYLEWSYREVLRRAPDQVRVRHVPASALGVADLPDGSQRVQLCSGEVIDADFVLYALGHTGVRPDKRRREFEAFADEHGLFYLGPEFTADADFSAVRPGETVIVSGFGLAAVDLTVLLTEGRGGRFEPLADGRLRYLPSGTEPKLVIGSRRGVPYHSKIEQQLRAEPAPPTFFSADVVAELAKRNRVDFAEDVWPLIARELLWGWYYELAVGTPWRIQASPEEIAAALSTHAPDSAELAEYWRRVVPADDDRLDLTELFEPTAATLAEDASLQAELVRYVERDLRQRTSPESSASLGLFLALLRSTFTLAEAFGQIAWTARSRAVDWPEWHTRVFSYVASGPPPFRLRELLALVDAGLVRFAGAGLRVQAEPNSGQFVAVGSSGEPVRARAFVEAWLPATDAERTDNPALADLVGSGVAGLELVADEDFAGSTGKIRVDPVDNRVQDAQGRAHPRRFAIGLYTDAPFVGAFSRPRSNALAFRAFDRVARAVLHSAARIQRERALQHDAEPSLIQ